jgi:hypothetical protein
MQKVIKDCHTIYFMNKTDPVSLHTDASDYGAGALVFPGVNGKECFAAFLLHKSSTRKNWTTQGKDARTIVWSMTNLKYLIRDRFFTLRTNQANLQYINTHSSEEVMRWTLALSEYHCVIEHIPG